MKSTAILSLLAGTQIIAGFTGIALGMQGIGFFGVFMGAGALVIGLAITPKSKQ